MDYSAPNAKAITFPPRIKEHHRKGEIMQGPINARDNAWKVGEMKDVF